MVPKRKPDWRLPPGVTRGTWDYVNSDTIAQDYDDYFSYSQMFEFDQEVLRQHVDCSDQPYVADLGCGTGRASISLAARGARVLAVDLSEKMLDLTLAKAESADIELAAIRANLVELDGFQPQSVDYAVCLFSTLGMIQGHRNRTQVLKHARRMLKPQGKLVLHVHNMVANVTDPGGLRWVCGSMYKSIFWPSFELGDKHFGYRGLPSMFLHTFSSLELKTLLVSSGFQVEEWIPVDATAAGPLRWPWLLSSLRASGWIVVARCV